MQKEKKQCRNEYTNPYRYSYIKQPLNKPSFKYSDITSGLAISVLHAFVQS